MSLACMCVALSAAFVYAKKTVVLSVLGTYFSGIVLDYFIFDSNKKRRICIITKKEEALRKFIVNDLHSGATIYEAIGAYNFEKHNEIITIVDKSEYQKLMMFINREDSKAFITVYFITVYNVSNMQYQPKPDRSPPNTPSKNPRLKTNKISGIAPVMQLVFERAARQFRCGAALRRFLFRCIHG